MVYNTIQEVKNTMEYPGIAKSQLFKQFLDQARQFAQVPRPILIRGERGTGKEMLAQFIH